MEAQYRIEILGGLRVWRGSNAIDRFPTIKSALLLAYLAVVARGTRAHRATSRDELAELFWPEALPGRARRSLCQALWLLRQVLAGKNAGDTLFLTDRASVALNPAFFRVDVVEFEAALQTADVAGDTGERQRRLVEALGLYHGELLAGYADTWLLAQRITLAESYFSALRRLLALMRAAGEARAAVAWAREGLRQDPLREEVHRDLIRLLVAEGEPEAALRQYQELTRLLRAELDTSPSAATRELVRTIQRHLARDRSPTVRRRATRRSRPDRPPYSLLGA